MSDTSLPVIVRFDTTAARTAFTPTPGVAEQLYIWLDSDDQPNAYYWDGAAWQLLNSSGAGGDVTGPGSSTDNAIALFDGTTGKVIQNSLITVDTLGVVTFPHNATQIFNPGTDNAGVNVGSFTSDPASPTDGDCWYNSTTNQLKARINGATVVLGAGGSSSDYKLSFTIDGGGSAVGSTGLQKYFSIPVTGTINRVRVLADQPGDIIYDLWNDSWANRPPTVVDSITASAKPTLSSAQFYEDATLTGWSTGVTIGDLMAVNIDTVGIVTWSVIELFITPS